MNINENAQVSASQTSRILSYMLEGHTINPLEALDKFGCFRLGARIKDIEKMTGYTPKRDRVAVTNRDGKTVRVARYWL